MVLVRSGVSKPGVIEDALWDRIEPLLPRWPDRSPGPRPVPDRQCLQGILFVLYTGIGWEDVPQDLGLRLRDNLLALVEAVDRGGRIRTAAPPVAGRAERRRRHRLVPSCEGRQPPRREKAGAGTGPSPVNRGKPGSKHQLICDGSG